MQNEELNSAHPMRKYVRASRSGGWSGRVSCAALHGRSEDAGSIEGPIVSWLDRYMSCNPLASTIQCLDLSPSRALCLTYIVPGQIHSIALVGPVVSRKDHPPNLYLARCRQIEL